MSHRPGLDLVAALRQRRSLTGRPTVREGPHGDGKARMPNYVIHAQTRKIFVPIMHGRFDKELVTWHLVDLDLGVTDPFLICAICGERVDVEYTLRNPQPLQRWATYRDDDRCDECAVAAGDGPPQQVKAEQAKRRTGSAGP